MALVTEDGTGLPDAESYISIADASTYHNARGNAAWDLLDEDVKEQNCRKATEYMLQVYRHRWKGVRMTATQALDWPRAQVYLEPVVTGASTEFPNLVDDDIVPTEVERACAELALKASSGTLYPDLTQQKKSVVIGPIETVFDHSSNPSTRYKSIDGMLAPYMATAAGQLDAIRV